MLKASALYMVIIIALVIAVICSSLIVSAYFYRAQYQKNIRYTQLQINLESATNIILAGGDTSYTDPKSLSLFNLGNDSVSTQRVFWGAFDIGVARAFIQSDTLYKTFSIANAVDSNKWAALYLADNSRPLSLSGKTSIVGDVYISPAGVNQAYVNNQAYSGDKRLIIGKKHNSEKALPSLNANRIQKLQNLILKSKETQTSVLNGDSISNSFLNNTKVVDFKNTVTTLQNIRLSGNVILYSDTSLTIDSTAVLNNIIVIAKSITVHSGFRGICQLFATDSISIQKNSVFNYPSCLGILRFPQNATIATSARIALYTNTSFTGSIFIYEKQESKAPPVIHIGKGVKIKGQVYSPGYVELEDQAEIDGSVFTNKFLYQTSFTRYENYIVNATINAKLLSPYYLTAPLFPAATANQKVLQWLEAN